MNPPDMLHDALALAARGWPVFAAHAPRIDGGAVRCSCGKGAECRDIGKHPRYMKGTLEHGLRSATTDPAIIRSWWGAWPDANIAVATGAASGLVVIDLDPRNGSVDAWAELEAKHGKTPDTVTALTGGGGMHLFFAHPGPGFMMKSAGGALGPGIDIKADGGYVVAAPSLHRSGKRYAWELSSQPGEVPLAPLPEWVRCAIEKQKGNTCPSNPLHLHTSTPLALCSSASLPLCNSAPLHLCSSIASDVPPEVMALIERTLPPKPGKRREYLHLFVRGLKFELGYAKEPVATFRPWVAAWHAKAWPKTSRTTPEDETWMDFVEFWPEARFPLDCDLAEEAMKIAVASPLPEAANLVSDPKMRLLVGICYALQQMVGTHPFSLSGYQVEKLLGIKPTQGWRWLHGLVTFKILECVDRGRPGPGGVRGSASRWKYVAGTGGRA